VKKNLVCCALVLCAGLPAGGAVAAEEFEEELVVVARTGSRIKQQGDLSSPFVSYGIEALQDGAMKDFRDLVEALPINAGAENNSDNLTQNFGAGTANFNLRGLGVASTLVLLNGRRQVLSSVTTDDGASFVDIAALAPALAIERVEILKDGASAIYGSDAVAGVVNFITRRRYEGAQLQAEYRTRTNNGHQEDVNVDGVFGTRLGDNGALLLAASYLKRNMLSLNEVDWRRPSTSGFGNPGSFNVPSLRRVVADPGCAANGGLLQQLANDNALCRFDFGPQITAVPNEDRWQTYGRLDWELGDNALLWAEFGYAVNDIRRITSPSFPVLNTPLVPANNPGNIFGEEVYFQGRPYGVGQPPEDNFYKHDTLRFAIGAEGDFSNDLSWDFSYARGVNNADTHVRDVVADNFQLALRGFGGDGCDPATMAAGQGDCLFFNPFSSVFSARPGDPTYNDPSLRAFIIGDYLGDARSELQVFEANLTGQLFQLPGGPVGFAIGAQYRDESVRHHYNDITRRDGFAFLFGNANFSGDSDSYGLYGEALLPLTQWLELTGALRYEDYGASTGDTLDPKIAVLLRLSDRVSLRGSYSTSFRAPSAFQTQGAQTNFVNIRDFDGSSTFAALRTVGNPALQPETSRAFNVGAAWQPQDNMELSVDYWNYAFEDVLRKENGQAIVSADPFDPRVRRTAAGTVSLVNVAFINADSIDTSGVDFAARAAFDTGFGVLSPFFEATWLLTYDVINAGVKVDGLGRLNRTNVGAPTQKFKGSLGLNWARNRTSLNLLLRHVGSYEDDLGGDIDAFTTLDAHLRFGFGDKLGDFLPGAGEAALRVGAVNLLDEDPPAVNIAGSYDPRSADPRGRRFFIKLETNF